MHLLYKAYQILWLDHPIRRRVCIAGVVFLLALSARVHLAVSGRIEYDEKDYARAAVQYANDLKSGDLSAILQDDYNYEHPVFNKLIYSLALLPYNVQSPFDLSMHSPAPEISHFHEVAAMRLVSAGFGSLTAFLLALVNPLAGLFLAVHTFAVKYTSVIYLEALPSFAALVSLQAFSIFLKRGPGKQTFKWLVLSAAALGIATASKYMYAVIGVAAALFCGLWMIRKRRMVLGYLAIWAFLALLVFWAADPVLWIHPVQRLSASLKFNVNFSQGPAVAYTAYPVWQPVRWLLESMPQQPLTRNPFFLQPGDFWVSIDTWIFGLALIGLPLTIKRRPEYFIWLVVGLAFLLVWSTKWPQYVLLVLPALCLAAAEGVQTIALVGKMGWQKAGGPIAAAVYYLLTILLSPIMLIGYTLMSLSFVAGRKSAVSGTALAALYGRGLLHNLGSRQDEPAQRLMMAMAGLPVSFTLGPMIFAHRVSGYMPKAYRYPFQGEITLGQETEGKRAWGGFAIATVK